MGSVWCLEYFWSRCLVNRLLRSLGTDYCKRTIWSETMSEVHWHFEDDIIVCKEFMACWKQISCAFLLLVERQETYLHFFAFMAKHHVICMRLWELKHLEQENRKHRHKGMDWAEASWTQILLGSTRLHYTVLSSDCFFLKGTAKGEFILPLNEIGDDVDMKG